MEKCKYSKSYQGQIKPKCNKGQGCEACNKIYNKRYRFFFHYRKMDGKMSVHFRDKCLIVNEVECSVPCVSKRNKRQPKLVMQGRCRAVKIEKGKAIIT